MFFIRISLILAIFYLFNPLTSRETPLSVVIIGGGPTGLATAIEAKVAGANVVIVEKRERYSREQFVFLLDPALGFLNKWKVFVPELILGEEAGEKVGVMRIKDLEIALAQRVNELGIPKIFGEFQNLKDEKVVISQQNRKIELSYDILVGADGTHSAVRDHLKITSTHYGDALGSIAVIPIPIGNENMEFIEPFSCDTLFFTKIVIPSTTIISAQARELSKQLMVSGAIQCGWLEEADFIFSDKAKYFADIEIRLQQSKTFSDIKKSAILLGDAAASASFLVGMGANCGLETAMVAGRFFRTEQNEIDYVDFNHAMQDITDRLINGSLFLFK